MSRWLLIDGFNLVYRCFFATPALTRADGFPTNALHGWVKSIWRLMDQEKPDHTVVFFDLGGSQDRLALHPEYKAQRAEMPAELERQIEPVKTVTRALGLAAIEQDGVESDDLLASCAVARATAGDEVLIVSSDKDFAQIVNDRIRVLLPPPSAMPKLGWRILDAAGVKEKFGVPPSLITDYLALIGDTSDNIPGLSGVGPKTAVKWLEKHGSLEGALAASDKIEPERFRAALAEAAERLRLNKRLVTLNTALVLPAVEQTAPDITALFGFLRTMEMRSTLAEAEQRYGQPELF
ncbi:MAG: 5'-3' exonuclease [Opitutaceae bacterium]|jgi:DNA polymerase-1|nr:5'-3' exonuclease [Opitutaceae bacterium]